MPKLNHLSSAHSLNMSASPEISPPAEDGEVVQGGEKDECRTPVSKEEGVAGRCPPAPVKARPAARRKRRAPEVVLIEVGTEELERLFRPREWGCSGMVKEEKKRKRRKKKKRRVLD
ncbi:Cyclin-dependent protein kinase inhibitor EL2 [Apostasia shenzhenica]|uniref:Cyclin-dependent protein kinase inhibitor EL2 n=1 Tax=Apostasia shenzhenica TaxID=1088818 RepID=A0A2H9ZXQ9_9ASPA|nr:Cyclin-dependent protein kinase inhibitor EL2 [Apostasia shenzhenica]